MLFQLAIECLAGRLSLAAGCRLLLYLAISNSVNKMLAVSAGQKSDHAERCRERASKSIQAKQHVNGCILTSSMHVAVLSRTLQATQKSSTVKQSEATL